MDTKFGHPDSMLELESEPVPVYEDAKYILLYPLE